MSDKEKPKEEAKGDDATYETMVGTANAQQGNASKEQAGTPAKSSSEKPRTKATRSKCIIENGVIVTCNCKSKCDKCGHGVFISYRTPSHSHCAPTVYNEERCVCRCGIPIPKIGEKVLRVG
jgi:hypothetical protein